MGTKTFDMKCLGLAEMFLGDEPWYRKLSVSERARYADAIASEIQQTIEDEIESYRQNLHVDIAGGK